MRRRRFLTGVVALSVSPVHARETFHNATALSGDRFLAGGDEFRLADIIAPPLYRLNDAAAPYFADARMGLQNALDSALEVALELEDVLDPTRWGVRRVVAKRAGEEITLQEKLIAAGAARVAPQTKDHAFIARLLQREAAARAERRGLWTLADYAIHPADDAGGAIGGYHLIEGEVMRAEKHGSRFYLNFGEDFRIDFTAGVASRLYNRWVKSGADFSALPGVQVRVRGTVEAINGPSIDLKHPMQVERLD